MAPEGTPVRLEPLSAAHLDALSALVQDPEVQRFTRVPVPPPPDFARSWFRRYEQGRVDGTSEAFAILGGGDDAPGGPLLGLAVAPHIDREARTAELGYMVSPDARGRGVATQALRLLTGWAFTELGARRLELLISVDNETSKVVATRCGYTKEGVLRGTYFKQDQWTDTEMWSRLSTDP